MTAKGPHLIVLSTLDSKWRMLALYACRPKVMETRSISKLLKFQGQRWWVLVADVRH